MPPVSFDNLLIVSVVAVLAPLVAGALPALRVPAVVLEIVAGIVLGPTVLGWVHRDLPVQILSLLGLAFLLFLAGLEIDLVQLRGRPLARALVGYLLSLALGAAAGFGLHLVGWVRQPILIAVALSATSLGLVIPVLKDARQVDSSVGRTAIASATVADFGAIVLLSFLFSVSGGSTGSRVELLVGFVVLVALTTVLVRRAGRSMRLGDTLVRLQDTTAEIRVRLAVLLLILFVVLAGRFGLESILGAFLAGAVVTLVDHDASSHPQFRTKLEAIGYGFVIPVFFVGSGISLDLTGLLHSPGSLVRVPVFLLALLLVRGLPALLGLRELGARATAAVALLQATSLPFLVAASQIGVVLDLIAPVTAAALVCAGLLSVLLLPSAALALLSEDQGPSSSEPPDVHARKARST